MTVKTETGVTMRVVSIVEGTTVDGPGLRTSIYFAGCEHHCPGCHNPHTWDPSAGEELSVQDIIGSIEASEAKGVTFSGGDPLFQASSLAVLARCLHLRGYDIWCYTGYTYEHIASIPAMRGILAWINVLVDGPFVEDLRDTTGLLFRGSSNQRLIDVPRSLEEGHAVEWQPDVDPAF